MNLIITSWLIVSLQIIAKIKIIKIIIFRPILAMKLIKIKRIAFSLKKHKLWVNTMILQKKIFSKLINKNYNSKFYKNSLSYLKLNLNKVYYIILF